MPIRFTDTSADLAGLITSVEVFMRFTKTRLTAYFAGLGAGVRINMRYLSYLSASVAVIIVMPVIHVAYNRSYISALLAIKVKAGGELVGRPHPFLQA